MQPQLNYNFSLAHSWAKLAQQAIKEQIVKSVVFDGDHPMVVFPDGEKITFDREEELKLYLEALLKGAEMHRLFSAPLSFLNENSRKVTEKWISTQQFVAVAYYGDNCPELWEVLDLYAASEQEGYSFEDALELSFPQHFAEIEVAAVQKETKRMIQKAIKYYDDCQHKLVFVAGKLME